MPPPARDACDSVIDALSSGAPLPPHLDAHARACPRCAPLTRLDALLDVPLGPPLAMSPALLEALQDARPVPRRGSLLRAAPTLLVCVGAVLAQRLAGASGGAMRGAGALLLGVGLAGIGLVFWRGEDGVGSPARWRRVYPVLAATLAAVLAALRSRSAAVMGAMAHPAMSPGTAVDGISHAQGTGADEVTATFVVAVVVTAIAATAALLGARRTTPNLPALSGATAGAASALVGLAVAHQGALPGSGMAALAHVALVVAASVVGAVVGRASLAP